MIRPARNQSDLRQPVFISTLAIHHWPLQSGTRQKSRAIAGKSRDAAVGLTFKYAVRYNASSHIHGVGIIH